MSVSPFARKGFSPAPDVVDVYCRLSLAVDGSEVKVEAQEAWCRAYAKTKDLTVGEVHVDNNLSAWKTTVVRPGWAALLERIRTGQTAGVISIHDDRLMRHPKDCETLMEAADAAGFPGFRFYGTSGVERNLSDDQTKTLLRMATAMAWQEVANISRRVKHKVNNNRKDGIPGGDGRCFGYIDKTVKGKRVNSWTPDPKQAAMIRYLVGMVLDDEWAWSDCANALNEAGFPTRTGGKWNRTNARRMLLLDRHGGITRWVAPDGSQQTSEIVAPDDLPDGEPFPILDRATFDRFHSHADSLFRGRPTTTRSLCAGIVRCGVDGKAMVAHFGTRKGRPYAQYRCSADRCYNTAPMSRMDAFLEEVTLSWYQSRAPEVAKNQQAEDAELADARKVVRQIEDNMGAFTAKMTARGKSTADIDRMDGMVKMTEALERADAKVAELDVPGRAVSVVVEDARAQWAKGNPARRKMLRAAITSASLARATGRGGPHTFDYNRITVKLR